MVALIVVNGPPGVGKSTVATRYAADHPLILNLDVDLVRRQLGAWREHPIEAGELARRLVIVMAVEHLRSGRSVIVPQYLGRPEFLDQLAGAASTTGAQYIEVALMAAPGVTKARFEARTAAAVHPSHLEAAAMLEAVTAENSLSDMCRRVEALLDSRPSAHVIWTDNLSEHTAYSKFRDLIDNGLTPQVCDRLNAGPGPGAAVVDQSVVQIEQEQAGHGSPPVDPPVCGRG